MVSREQRTPFSEWWWTVDRPLLAAIVALILGGVILSLAASPPVATRIGLDPFHFFNRHVMFLVPSFIVLIGVSFLSPRQIRRAALIVFAISIVLIVATLLFGPEVKGSRRWITLLGLNIQASESAKPAFVVMAAWLFAESARRPEMAANPMGLGGAVLYRGHADDLGGGARGSRRRRAVRRLSFGAACRRPYQTLHESGV